MPPGDYRIVEIQPSYIYDGAEQLGSAGGTVANDAFTLTVPQNTVQGVGYNFGERGLIVGDNPNGDPPLRLHRRTPRRVDEQDIRVGPMRPSPVFGIGELVRSERHPDGGVPHPA